MRPLSLLAAAAAVAVLLASGVAVAQAPADPGQVRELAEQAKKKKDAAAEVHHLERYLQADPAAMDREEVEKRIAALTEKLLKNMGAVDLRSGPSGATFKLNAKKVHHEGATPWKHWVKPGKYGLVVEKPGYMKETRVLDVVKGGVLEVRVQLSEEME